MYLWPKTRLENRRKSRSNRIGGIGISKSGRSADPSGRWRHYWSADDYPLLTLPHCSKSSFFVQNSTLIFRENRRFFLVKNSWKCCGLDFLAVDNFDFTRKIVKIFFDKKLVKILGFCQNEFLDKNLTIWTVCLHMLQIWIFGVKIQIPLIAGNCINVDFWRESSK